MHPSRRPRPHRGVRGDGDAGGARRRGLPGGGGFLWARADRQADLHPAVISNQYGQGFTAGFDLTGTCDPSAWLSVPEAIAFHRDLGDADHRAANRRLAAEAARLLTAARGTGAAAALHDRMWRDRRIEVPVLPIADALRLRISAQAYNEIDECERLAGAVTT